MFRLGRGVGVLRLIQLVFERIHERDRLCVRVRGLLDEDRGVQRVLGVVRGSVGLIERRLRDDELSLELIEALLGTRGFLDRLGVRFNGCIELLLEPGDDLLNLLGCRLIIREVQLDLFELALKLRDERLVRGVSVLGRFDLHLEVVLVRLCVGNGVDDVLLVRNLARDVVHACLRLFDSVEKCLDLLNIVFEVVDSARCLRHGVLGGFICRTQRFDAVHVLALEVLLVLFRGNGVYNRLGVVHGGVRLGKRVLGRLGLCVEAREAHLSIGGGFLCLRQ